MKKVFDIKQLKPYLWIGLAYFVVWLIADVSKNSGMFPERLINNIWRAVYIVLVNFLFFEHGLPFIMRRKNIFIKILLAILVLWVLLMLYSFGAYAWRHIGIRLHLFTALRTFPSIQAGVTHGFPHGFGSLFFFGIIKHIYDYRMLLQASQQLRIEKQEAELNYLKSQTNPHFLFNTLNNIYSLTRDKSELAPESILRLSEILRYMLYEAGGAYIALEQELKIINDYIALEKLRYDDSLRINFNHDVEDMKQALPPLLLIPLVENAFKHGVSETRNNPFIDIHLSVNKRQLTFFVKNSTDTAATEGNGKENIGLSNLRRQLELLYKEYELSVQPGDSVFTATLKINLASHV